MRSSLSEGETADLEGEASSETRGSWDEAGDCGWPGGGPEAEDEGITVGKRVRPHQGHAAPQLNEESFLFRRLSAVSLSSGLRSAHA